MFNEAYTMTQIHTSLTTNIMKHGVWSVGVEADKYLNKEQTYIYR